MKPSSDTDAALEEKENLEKHCSTDPSTRLDPKETDSPRNSGRADRVDSRQVRPRLDAEGKRKKKKTQRRLRVIRMSLPNQYWHR